jgi:DNA-binding winged helix-turn-helix (wHTH) protein
MRSYNSNRELPARVESAFASTDPRISDPRATYLRNSTTRPGQDRRVVGRTRMPATWQNGLAELPAEIDGLPVLFRILVKAVPAEMQSGKVARYADINSMLSSTLEQIMDRMRALRRDDSSKPPLAIVEMISSGESPAGPSASPTVLRVGPLELDLLDRAAKRGDRQIDLRPREFQLLKYMMERSDKLLTRETLFKDVWHYKFAPETNLVDVHMGRLRRKVDGPNEPPMIGSVRGAGFVLSASPL